MQLRFSLVKALERLQAGIDWQVSIEAGDDIEIEEARGFTSYYQIKHRSTGTAITDSTADLWKTLRIWCTALEGNAIDVPSTHLILVTTASAPEGTIAAHLSSDPAVRDLEAALTTLNGVAETSRNEDLEKAFTAWKKLAPEQRSALLSRITVVPQSPDIDQAAELLRRQLALSTRRNHLSPFVERLEGWWFQRCIKMLRASQAEFVTGAELDAYISELRESFLPENLPVDPEILLIRSDPDTFQGRRFVEQVRLIGAGESRIASAVRDYLRAYTQRSRWTREFLLGPGELERYEQRITEEWRYVFDRCSDHLWEGATEELMLGAAREIYQWVEEATAEPIRTHCTEKFIVRGSLHMLADRAESGVGWHPDFAVRLVALLEPVGVDASD
jgi:hypothetical protein